MRRSCLDMGRVTDYIHGDIEIEAGLDLERHVNVCKRCREKVRSMKRFSERLFEDFNGEGTESTSCPSPIQLRYYANELLRERQLVHVQQHVRTCSSCQKQLQTQSPASRNVCTDSREASMLATRPADLDIRFATEGLRVASGEGYLQANAFPTLIQRLGLELDVPVILASPGRSVFFQKRGAGFEISGRLQLVGQAALRCEFQAAGDELTGNQGLQLWDRKTIWPCRRSGDRRWLLDPLLEPGFYFMGPAAGHDPWFAFVVEPEIFDASVLARLAFTHCCWGRFATAIRIFNKATRQQPLATEFARMLSLCQKFAMRYDLGIRDVEFVFSGEPANRQSESVERPQMDLTEFIFQNHSDALVSLIRSLATSVEPDVYTLTVAPSEQCRPSERFKQDYVDTIQRLVQMI